MDTLGSFSSSFTREITFMTFSFTREITFNFLFVFLHTKSLLKAVFSERKEFASKGSKFFSFFFFLNRLLERREQNHFDRVVDFESVSVPCKFVIQLRLSRSSMIYLNITKILFSGN